MKKNRPARFLELPFLLLSLFFAPQNTAAQFVLNGSATQTLDTCWTLTPAENFAVGSIWNETKVNLNESFQVLMQLNFGGHNSGADGILFGLQPLSTSIGQAGEGLGFQGVSPSLGIEFDTYKNNNLDDPGFDHLAIMRDGILNHGLSNNLAGPVQSSASEGNVEDGEWHQLRVNWDANALTIEVWFDCELRLSYTGDIVNDIFNGDPEVFWGFTAATGAKNNLQQVCLSYTTFLDGFDDVVICPGGQLQLHVGGGTSYHWTPETGLSNPNIPNPIAAPAETTTYTVEVTDDCHIPFFDSLTVFVDGDTVFFDLGPDTVFCQGGNALLDATSSGTDTVVYQWSNGADTPFINPTLSGNYAVTVTLDDYCMADDRVRVNVIPLPENIDLGPDTVLCFGQAILLDASSGGNPNYEWPDGSTSPVFEVTEAGKYSVFVVNQCGEGEASVLVGYEDCRQVYFPTAFSPNGDGINDVFLPFDGGGVSQIRQFKIFDRWGGLVFENHNFPPSDFAEGWNGTARGEAVSPGVYVWLAEVEFRDGYVEMRKGEVVVVK